jgi:hypothetical protein
MHAQDGDIDQLVELGIQVMARQLQVKNGAFGAL